MKKIFFRISALLIGIGFVLISLELFLRLNPKFGYVYQSFNLSDKKAAPQTQFFIRDSYRPSALLGYEYIPHGQNGRINSYGMVGKEYKLKKDRGIFRILVLGDSIAAQGWPCEFLEDQLNNNNLLHSKYKFEIWNAGVGSYDVRRYAVYLKHKGLRYSPDMVIIFLFMNDFEAETNIYYKTETGAVAYSFPLSEVSKRYTASPFLMRYSYLYRFIILRINNYLINKKKTQGNDSEEEAVKYYLQLIKDMCESKKIPLFVIIFPYLKPLDKYEDYQLDEYQTICKVTKEFNLNYLNLYESLPEKALYGMRVTKEDEMHPDQEGHRLIAKIIYAYLLDKFFEQ